MVLPPEAVIFLTSVAAWFSLYLIISISLNLEFGYTGIPNFGKMLVVVGGAFVAGYIPGRFMLLVLGSLAEEVKIDCGIALGRYLTSLEEALENYIKCNPNIVTWINDHLANSISMTVVMFVATLGVAAAIGAGLGFIASYPAIRLREEYLAMTLLAMAELLNIVGYYYDPLVGGTLGVQVPDVLAFVSRDLRFPMMSLVLLAVAALFFVYVNRLVNSPLGRTLRAVRESDLVANMFGKDIVRIRMKVMIVSSMIGAVGGALHALYTSGVIALTYDRVSWTFWPWVMVLMGGMSNNLGVALGVLAFVTIRQLITFYKYDLAPLVPFNVVWLDFLLLGSSLLAILMLRPQGILPEKPVNTIGKRRVREITSSQ